ncbi:Gfo/Idh/MocA family oxidoreductase [Bacillaceae bacterium Marseille-Q3522]|nr:Gfo/Idh/MocA family oxidoreductase [Bacillaceae bacterium Marseille-Q3522]
MKKTIRLGVLGLDTIERTLIPPVKEVEGLELFGVSTRNKQEAVVFAEKYGVANVYDTFEELLQDKKIDAVYIGTFNTLHREDILLALQYGKHVVAEKPATISLADYEFLKSEADKRNLIFTEAITLYYMPLTKIILEIVKTKKLGELQYLLAPFATRKPRDPDNRFFNKELGGGALFDVGVYALSLCAMCLDTDADYELFATGMLAGTGVDDQSVITLKNAKGQMAVTPITFSARMAKEATLAFDEGYIVIDTYPCSEKATIFYNNGKVESLTAGDSKKALAYEMEAFTNDFMKGKYEATKQFQKPHYYVQKWLETALSMITD